MNKPYQTVAEFMANNNKPKATKLLPELTPKYINQLLDDIIKKSPKPSPFVENWTEDKKLAYTLIGKTDSELDELLPNRYYQIGDKGGMTMYTGKGGMINFIHHIHK